MAIAAGVAAAAATAVSVGMSAANAAGAFGPGDPGDPEFKQVPKRPFETAQQKYMSRVMLANLNNRGPSYEEWLKSGGTAKFELNQPGMSAGEAKNLGFVGAGGREPIWYDPAEGGNLSQEQYLDYQRNRGPQAMQPLGRVTRRIEKLQGLQESGQELRPGQSRRLERLQDRQQKLLAKNYHPASTNINPGTAR